MNSMSTHRHLLANWITWLLVPLMALGGLSRPLCLCDHSHGGGHGHGVTSSERSSELNHSGGHDHEQHAAQSGHNHGGSNGKQQSHGSDCESSEDCECAQLQTVADRVAKAPVSDARKFAASGPVDLPPSLTLLPPSVGFAYVHKWQRAGNTHSPPLFLLNCTFLC